MTRPISLATPRVGFYLVRLVKDGPQMPAVIFRPCPIEPDPETFQWIDRRAPLQAAIAGEEVPMGRVWPHCARWPITHAEFVYRTKVIEWAETYAPSAPEARPREAVDLNRLESIF